MKSLELKEKIMLVLTTLASLYALFFILRSCNPEPMPIATDNHLEDYLRDQIKQREYVNDRLWDSIAKLQDRKEKVVVKYKVIREKLATFQRPEMQEYFNELSQTDNVEPYVNLDSVGSVGIANKIIDGQVAKAKLDIAEEQITLQGKVIQLKDANISDLNVLNQNAEANIQSLEKSLNKKKKSGLVKDILIGALLVGIIVK